MAQDLCALVAIILFIAAVIVLGDWMVADAATTLAEAAR